MADFIRVAMAVTVLWGVAAPATAQEGPAARQAYFRAVADFFQIPREESDILGEWDIPAGELPVALFVAGRAGVSPEALVALRRSGWSWPDLARRYHLDASHFHVPLSEGADAGVLAEAYQAYRSLQPRQWRTMALDDREVVTLVNLRLISQTLRMPAEEVLARVRTGVSWPGLYAELLQIPSHLDRP